MGILDLPGPDFLALYVTLLAIAAPVTVLLRQWLRPPRGKVDIRFLSLRPLEVAYLAGGEHQAVSAVVASLAQQKLVTVTEGTKPSVVVAGPVPAGADSVEQGLLQLLGTETTTIERISGAATRVLEPLREKLTQLGLLIPDSAQWIPRLVPALVLLAVLALGVVKVVIGISRDRPVGFLVTLCLVVAGAIAWLLVTGPRRSLLGDWVLDRLRAANTGLQQTASVKPDRLSSDDLALAVALFGASAITSGPMAALGRAMTYRSQPATSGCSSGCGGGSCGGGGGCGGCGS